MADYRVYHEAARAFMHGESVYHIPFGTDRGVYSGLYKYAPALLLIFAPLALLPYKLASSIFYFLIVWVFYRISFQLLRAYGMALSQSERYLVLIIGSVLLSDHLIRELHLGNINLLLLLLFMGVWHMDGGKKYWSSGICLGLGWISKPHFLILLPFFVLMGRWKTLLSALLALVVLVAIPAFFVGWSSNFKLFSDWILSMQAHNEVLVQSPNTIYGLIYQVGNHLLKLQFGNLLVLFTLGLVAAGILLLFIHAKRQNKALTFIYFLLIALIPNLTHTDTEHFLWSFPLIVYLVANLLKEKAKWRWVMVALCSIPYSLNTPDLWGKTFSLIMDQGGIGLANLIFIAMATGVFVRESHENMQ